MRTDVWSYAGQRVVIADCHSGMGEATARELVRLGAEVHGVDIKRSPVDLASFREVDLRDTARIDAALAAIFGPLDASFYCAGLPQTFPNLDVLKVNFVHMRPWNEQVVARMPNGGALAMIASTAGHAWHDHREHRSFAAPPNMRNRQTQEDDHALERQGGDHHRRQSRHRTITLRFAREGAKIVVGDIREAQAQEVVQEITSLGGEGLALGIDVSKEQDTKRLAATTHEHFGRIDILLNNAAIFYDMELKDQSLEYFNKILSVNLTGVWLCSRAVEPYMKRQRKGKIINQSSTAAYMGPGGYV